MTSQLDMPDKHYTYLIIGGGLTAGYAAKTFVDKGVAAGEVAILSAESLPPYERPPLSKEFLAGDEELDEIWINTSEFYAKHEIALFLDHRVVRADFDNQRVQTENGVWFAYDQLLIATGSRARKLDMPQAEADNIFYLRRVGDSQRIREAAANAETAVVIGAGFIGMESASILNQEGVDTTLVYPQERVWSGLFTPEMSAFFENYYQERGVTLRAGLSAVGFTTDEGGVTGVKLDNGTTLKSDMVVAGIGAVPNVELFENTQLNIKAGVVVNRFLESNLPNVFAAGDVAEFNDVVSDTTHRVEHWDNAVAQGKHAAHMMLGKRMVFEHIPYFFSDVFDLSYEYWGDASQANEIIHRGDVDSGSFSVWWLKNRELQAAFVMDRPDEERELAQQWIKAGRELSAELLADASQKLAAADKAAV